MKFRSFSEESTEDLGKMLARKLGEIGFIALWGDMGAGKTAFTRGIAKLYSLGNMVSSPTFSIVNEYKNKDISIYHFDMYRVKSVDDLESTGYYDYLKKGLIIVEWSENIKEFIPQDAVNVFINLGETQNERIVEIRGIEF